MPRKECWKVMQCFWVIHQDVDRVMRCHRTHVLFGAHHGHRTLQSPKINRDRQHFWHDWIHANQM